MSFTVKANCQHGIQLIHRRKSPEAALKKARELLKTCDEVHIPPKGVTTHHRNSEIFHRRLVSCRLFVKPNLHPRRRLSGVRIAGTNRLSAYKKEPPSRPEAIRRLVEIGLKKGK